MRKKIFFAIISIAALGAYLLPPAGSADAYQPGAKITFTFDDGAKSIYERALPIMARYGLRGVFYGETGPLNSGEDWVMTWNQVRQMQNKYGWEIGSHSVNHPYLTQIPEDQIIQELQQSKADFAAQGIQVKTFSTPYGDYNPNVLSAIARFYESHRAAWGTPGVWPDTFNDYEIVAREVSNTTSPSEVAKWVNDAIAKKQWLVLLFHEIVRGQPQPYQYNATKFQTIASYVSKRPIKVVTMSEGLQLSSQPNLIGNYDFSQLNTNGWAANWSRNDETNVGIDQSNHGNMPESQNSLKIIGGASQFQASTPQIVVNSQSEYILKMYQNVQDRVSGGWAVWIDEFDSNGAWLSGKWLGGNYGNYVGTRYYQYKSTSSSVSKIQINLYVEANSQLTLYADSMELRAADPLVASGPSSGNRNFFSFTSSSVNVSSTNINQARSEAQARIEVSNNSSDVELNLNL